MIYKVVGELMPQGRFSESTEVDRHTREFEFYTDAIDYYSLTFGQVSEDIAEIGGEFVITLVAIADDDSGQVLRRHVSSTTILT